MSFDALETSEQGGEPVELYEFHYAGEVFMYTSAESNVEIGTDVYESEAIRRGPIAIAVDQPRNSLRLEVRRNFPIAELFRIAPPTEPVGLVLKRMHRSDGNTAVGWVGRVLNCSWSDTSTAELNCEPASISLKRNGLGRYYQVPCPFALFNPDDCKVDKTSFAHATTITAIDGLEVSVASVGSHPYPGGWAEWVDPTSASSNTERRLIVSRSSLVLTLSRPFSSAVSVTDSLTLYPGCDHSIQTCDQVYSNKVNYGGFPHFPRKNPFTGTPVY